MNGRIGKIIESSKNSNLKMGNSIGEIFPAKVNLVLVLRVDH